MRDKEVAPSIPGDGTNVWYKLKPSPTNNPYLFYLLSLFGKPDKTTFFVEVDTVDYAKNRTLIWNKLGFEFQIAPSKGTGNTAKFAFFNDPKALAKQFDAKFAATTPDPDFPVTGYYVKEACLILARDSTSDNSKFATVRGGKATNTSFTFEDLTTFLGFRAPAYLAAFFSNSALLKVDEGTGGVPARNGVWLWPAEAQRVELRLSLALDDEKTPLPAGTKTNRSLAQGILDLIAPGFVVADPSAFRLIAKKTCELDSTVNGGKTVKSSCSLDFFCPVTLTTTEKDAAGNTVTVTRQFNLILTIAGSSTTVRIQQLSSTGALGAILGWIGQTAADAAGIPNDGDLVGETKALFESDNASFKLDFRQAILRWTGRDNVTGGGLSPKLTAFEVDLEVQGKIGSSSSNISAQLAFKWEVGVRLAFIGSLWNEMWMKKATALSNSLLVGYEPYQTITRSPGTRNNFYIDDLVPNLKLPNFIPNTMQNFYIEVASGGVYLSAMMVAKPPDKDPAKVPMLEFSALRLRALMSLKGGTRTIGLGFSADVALRTRNPDKYPPALLNATIEYSNEKSTSENNIGGAKSTWSVTGSAKNLRVAHLVSLFSDDDQADGVMEFIESVGINTLTIAYTFVSNAPSTFKIIGQLAVGKLTLDLTMEATAKAFGLHAKLGANAKLAPPVQLGDLLRDLSADVADLLPPFVSDMWIDPSKDFGLELDVAMAPKATATNQNQNPAQFLAFKLALTLPKLDISFVQHRSPKTATLEPVVTRLLRVSFRSFPTAPKVPIVGEVTPTFEQLQFLWANVDVTKKVQDELNATVYEQESEKLYAKQVNTKTTQQDATTAATAIVLTQGCHFLVLGRPEGYLAVALDYALGSGKPKPALPSATEGGEKMKEKPATISAAAPVAQDGQLAVAPLRQNKGPLSVQNISFGASPKDSTITIKLDAEFQLGPVALSLFGFSVMVSNIGDWENLAVEAGIESMGVEYAQPPIVLAGGLRRSVTVDAAGVGSTAYTGAMVLTIPPYQLMAMGSYQSTPFTSLFVLALLAGPLAQFEVGEISGVTAGFGYNSRLKLPAPAEVTTHPFLADLSNDVAGGTGGTSSLMVKLTSGADFWFPKEQGSNWIAAGLTIKAMQTLSVNAVLAVEFGSGVQLAMFAQAAAQAPAAITGKTVRPILMAKLGEYPPWNLVLGLSSFLRRYDHLSYFQYRPIPFFLQQLFDAPFSRSPLPTLATSLHYSADNPHRHHRRCQHRQGYLQS
jgi:hypothetical protein